MKLSEALRLGEQALKPIHGKWFEGNPGVRFPESYEPCGGCAVGRACYAAAHRLTVAGFEAYTLSSFMDRTWPWTQMWSGTPPGSILPVLSRKATSTAPDRWHINHVMACLSDLYEMNRWSMQRIANWVETIEPQDVSPPAVTETAQLEEVR